MNDPIIGRTYDICIYIYIHRTQCLICGINCIFSFHVFICELTCTYLCNMHIWILPPKSTKEDPPLIVVDRCSFSALRFYFDSK